MRPNHRVFIAMQRFSAVAPSVPVIMAVQEHAQRAWRLNGRTDDRANAARRAWAKAVDIALVNSIAGDQVVQATRNLVWAITAASTVDALVNMDTDFHLMVRCICRTVIRYQLT